MRPTIARARTRFRSLADIAALGTVVLPGQPGLECALTPGARMFKEGLLKGKRILVTGGGTGLGKEIVARYLQLGAEIWIAGRRGPVLDSCAKELVGQHGGIVRTHAVD